MTGHVYLGYYVYASHSGVPHHAAYVVLCVEAAVKGVGAVYAQFRFGYEQVVVVLHTCQTHALPVVAVEPAPCASFRQQGISLYLYSPALIVGEMPMELVQLV